MVEAWNKTESGSLTDRILDGLNRYNDAKFTGALTDDELGKEILSVATLFQNQVKTGKKTEEDVMDFENLIPNGDYATRENLSGVLRAVKEGNTGALMERDLWNKKSQPVEGYSKGLRKSA